VLSPLPPPRSPTFFKPRFKLPPLIVGGFWGEAPPQLSGGVLEATSPLEWGFWTVSIGGQNAPIMLRGGVQNAPSWQGLCDVVHVGGVDGGGVEV
jgi:hypothetical protein